MRGSPAVLRVFQEGVLQSCADYLPRVLPVAMSQVSYELSIDIPEACMYSPAIQHAIHSPICTVSLAITMSVDARRHAML